ncbi:hypothetical protein HPB48_004406 [Haemaphysalis longicornis]|uniref:CCHC-type domain-containing protein n=1 Tax=Haemaphysalis longicornis TaxID=44386 RepID=A0A9J6G1I6_HAELO|nr:hypothetical protein HPB48_004406 [Haemaphysalis longicornis]
MEKMIIANPSNCGEFLQTLQRINQAALMARAYLAPSSFAMPGMQPWTTITPGMPSAAATTTQPFSAEQHVQRQDGNADNRELRAISESIDALTERLKAIKGQVRRPPPPWPPRDSRYDDGRPRCHYCKRVGHITRQCHDRYRDEEQQRLDRRGMHGEPPKL